jgi:hypothetical protein
MLTPGIRPSASAVVVIESRPKSRASESSYNAWYDGHLREVAGCNGFVAASRYRLSEHQVEPQPPGLREYLALYEAADLDLAVRSLREGQAQGRVTSSDFLEKEPFPDSVAYNRHSLAQAGAMPEARMLVYSQPRTPGVADDFDRWYDEVHVPELLRCDGVIGATRYRMSSTQLRPVPPGQHPCLAIYDLSDAKAATASVAERRRSGTGTRTSTIAEVPPPRAVVYDVITPSVTA